MPHLRLRHIALLITLGVSAACASASQNPASKEGKITPPLQLRAGPRPEIREEVDLRMEVLIDANGEPDMKTLKVIGKGSGSNHAALEDWIRNSTFRPAMQNGHPVPAVIKLGLKSRITVRRM